ncbi:MAG: sensor domain-containing diguanylate cyclase [Anaerolineales bacterium]
MAASDQAPDYLFEYAPISLWEEDYSDLKRYLDELRAGGITDLGAHLGQHPEIVTESMRRIRVIKVNRKTLQLFHAAGQEELLANLDRVFRDEMRTHFYDELLAIWRGEPDFACDGVNYTLDGEAIEIRLHWAALPGAEASYNHVLVSIEDITARKHAEDYLKYLGTHDVLTGLYNRAYFAEELARLGRGRRFPVSLIMADLNGLKPVNDSLGHAEGDKLLRRAAEVLQTSVRAEDLVTRTGGDEFAIILPATTAETAAEVAARIHNLVELNNKFYGTPELSLSLGTATGPVGANLNEVLREADDKMYVEKRAHHARHGGRQT